MSIDNSRFLLELDKHRREVNQSKINVLIDDINLETFIPIVEMVANSRASYIGELFKLTTNLNGKEPSNKQVSLLKEKRTNFEELVKAVNALETAIEREYLDIKGKVD